MTGRLDSLGVYEATLGLPEQIAAAVEVTHQLERLPDPETITNVLVLGMGGSGIAGDVLTVTAGPFLPVPVVVVKNHVPPYYANERTLVFACSFSGNTVETIESASTVAANGAQVVVVSSGGRLVELADSWGATVVPVDPSIPAPRVALGALAIPPLIVLENLGLFLGATEWTLRAVEQLRRRRDQLAAEDNPARALARRIGSQVPLVLGAGGIGSVAALRWKCQINENAKMPAFAAALPEMAHNEIVGWGRDIERTRAQFCAVQLRHEHEHPLLAPAFEVLAEMLADAVGDMAEVRGEGEGALAQLLDLAFFGDVTSLHHAFESGIDPGPIEAIDRYKAALAR